MTLSITAPMAVWGVSVKRPDGGVHGVRHSMAHREHATMAREPTRRRTHGLAVVESVIATDLGYYQEAVVVALTESTANSERPDE